MRTTIDLSGAAHKAPIPMAAKVGQFLITSAISGRDQSTGDVPSELADEVTTLFANLRAVLEAAGGTSDHVAKITFYVRDLGSREAINHEWIAMFPEADDRPARHTQVYDGMPQAYNVQAELIANIV